MKCCPICDSDKIRRVDKDSFVCLKCYNIFDLKELRNNK